MKPINTYQDDAVKLFLWGWSSYSSRKSA